MMPDRKRELDRRSVLRRLAVVSAAAGATATSATEASAYNTGSDETRARYQETPHVKAFYRTNGYETLKR
jgi:hypothetical protein